MESFVLLIIINPNLDSLSYCFVFFPHQKWNKNRSLQNCTVKWKLLCSTTLHKPKLFLKHQTEKTKCSPLTWFISPVNAFRSASDQHKYFNFFLFGLSVSENCTSQLTGTYLPGRLEQINRSLNVDKGGIWITNFGLSRFFQLSNLLGGSCGSGGRVGCPLLRRSAVDSRHLLQSTCRCVFWQHT